MTPEHIMEWCGVALAVGCTLTIWGALAAIAYGVYKYFEDIP